MYRIVEHRRWYFLLSVLIIVPGLIAMIYSTATIGRPFKVAIDFTGGAIWELSFDQPIMSAELRQVFVDGGFGDTAVTTLGDGKTAQIRLKPIDETQKIALMTAVKAKYGANVSEVQFALVGPAIGNEVTQAAFLAVFAASIAITAFLVIAFRKVPHPGRYGVSAIIAMVHDVLVTLGIFSIISLLLGWEADALLLTALLTVISFSVQDTIVVFDRIRENSAKYRGEAFSVIANRSLLETMHRSLATQLNALFIMAALLLFGGATIRQFIAVMFFGLISGTYSSIFNAVPILVGWEERNLLGARAESSASA
ncbi:MAG: Protein-export rane protein SecF [Chloroflexota bacterium]|nr:Protein-export rane protein SecF [Chloroflexota bacterium]